MKYIIVTLIRGEAKKYQQSLLHQIAEKFDVNSAIRRNPPAHITLKYSFETEKISTIENLIAEFCKTNIASKYKLKGLNHFDRNVIFIDVIPSKEMKTTYSKFIKFLKNNSNIDFKNFDGNTHFHCSIAHTDINDKFDEIWKFVAKEKPEFECNFDNITILKLLNGVWQTHKEFLLNFP